MNSSPLISIIIVVYNAESTIAKAIDSVLVQSFHNIELVIIDGKSTDTTILIVKNYGNKIGYFISEKDNGIYDAMNKGIVAAKGDWILFLGSDDCLISPNVIEGIFSNANYNSYDIIYGNVELSTSKKIFGAEKNYALLLEQNICHQAIFYNSNIFEKKGLYNTKYKILADYHYNLSLFRDKSLQKKYINTTIVLYNDKGVSNNTVDKNFFNDMVAQLVEVEHISTSNPAIQQYIFFEGLCEINDGNFRKGLIKTLKAACRSNKKVFLILVAIKYLFSLIGFGKKANFK